MLRSVLTDFIFLKTIIKFIMITIKPKLLGVMTLCVLFGSCTHTDIRNASATGSKDGSILPFPEPPSASTYGETIFESQHVRREQLKHLPPDAPNIVLVLMDDVGFGTPSIPLEVRLILRHYQDCIMRV